MNELVSIIVPVFNVEEYLPRCLDSIAAQTYKHLEVILVDDGSTDGSGRICDDFCHRDARFKVIHQENAWLARARNRGIEAATGAFLYFIDSDDAVHPRLLERALEAYHESGCDYVIVGHRREMDLKEPFGVDFLPEKPLTEELSGTAVAERILLEQGEDNMFAISWNKLIPRQLAEGLQFANIYGNEDVPFTLRLAMRSSRIILIKEPLYHYTIRPGSIMQGSRDKWRLNHLKMRLVCLGYIPLEDTRLRGLALRKLYKRILVSRAQMTGSPLEASYQELSDEVIRQTRKEFFQHPDIPCKEKFLFRFLRCNPWLLRIVFRIG